MIDVIKNGFFPIIGCFILAGINGALLGNGYDVLITSVTFFTIGVVLGVNGLLITQNVLKNIGKEE